MVIRRRPDWSRRRTFLFALGLMHIAYGATLALRPAAGPLAPYRLPIPLTVWGVIWVLTGAFCLIAARIRQTRLAFTAASFLHAGWTAQFLWVWWTQDYPRALSQVTVWAFITAVVLLVSSWPDPPAPSPDGPPA